MEQDKHIFYTSDKNSLVIESLGFSTSSFMCSFMERPNIIAQYIFAYNFHTSTDSYSSPTPHLESMKEQASSLRSLHRGNL